LNAMDDSVTVGVDLGGTSVRVGVYDCARQLLGSRSMATRVEAGPQSVVEEIASAIKELLQELALDGATHELIGVGIGSPGPINLETGTLGLLPNFPGWDDFPLRDALERAAELPVWLESDANAAALAEWEMGAGKATGLQSMAMITLGTGVGSGIILDGKVWHGMFGMGGEVGHATVDPNGPACPCGSRGCLELYASANGLMRLARGIAETDSASSALRQLVNRSEGFSPRDVASLAELGDASACEAFRRVGFHLGIGLANLINTLDLPMIVVGGGMATAWDLFSPAMFETIRDYSVVYRLVEPTQRTRMESNRTYIRPAMLGPAAGLLGAGLLPLLGSADAARADSTRLLESL
jgi:glucokinase